VICAADRAKRLPVLVWSLIAQTHTDWELLILDQSANGCVAYHVRDLRTDARVRVRVVPKRGDWGYSEKAIAARDMATGEALLFPQDDAYYVPIALEAMSGEIALGADLALCGWLYPLFGYAPMPPNPRVGHVDVGGFMVRRETFLAHGWPDDSHEADGKLVERLVASGVRVATCPEILYAAN
jgi:hypothetical protein